MFKLVVILAVVGCLLGVNGITASAGNNESSIPDFVKLREMNTLIESLFNAAAELKTPFLPVSIGMTKTEVTKIMKLPVSTGKGYKEEFYIYEDMEVGFNDQDQRVSSITFEQLPSPYNSITAVHMLPLAPGIWRGFSQIAYTWKSVASLGSQKVNMSFVFSVDSRNKKTGPIQYCMLWSDEKADGPYIEE